jgi:hypothetical protein
MELSIEERTRNDQKDALLAREVREFSAYLARVRRTVELPYANSLTWRISDVQTQLVRLLEACEPKDE